MLDNNSRSLDILCIKHIGDSVAHITKATVDGASSFLAKICLPAAEEFGLLLQDKVRSWRARNSLKILPAAQEKLQKRQHEQTNLLQAHPHLVSSILEHGFWNNDPYVQSIWGGLLASSCCYDGMDDSNIIFFEPTFTLNISSS